MSSSSPTAPSRPETSSTQAWPGWDEGVALVVAADGGVRHAAAFGMAVDRWVGDGDSTDPAELEGLAARGVVIDRVAVDKDESDTELALLAALEAGADLVTILGGLGGLRVDHAIANLALLQHPALDGRAAHLYEEAGARLSLLVGPDRHGLPGVRDLAGRAGDLVSLIPLGESAARRRDPRPSLPARRRDPHPRPGARPLERPDRRDRPGDRRIRPASRDRDPC